MSICANNKDHFTAMLSDQSIKVPKLLSCFFIQSEERFSVLSLRIQARDHFAGSQWALAPYFSSVDLCLAQTDSQFPFPSALYYTPLPSCLPFHQSPQRVWKK
jgi:hypothetical protein